MFIAPTKLSYLKVYESFVWLALPVYSQLQFHLSSECKLHIYNKQSKYNSICPEFQVLRKLSVKHQVITYNGSLPIQWYLSLEQISYKHFYKLL